MRVPCLALLLQLPEAPGQRAEAASEALVCWYHGLAVAVAVPLTPHDTLRSGSGAYREGGSLGESLARGGLRPWEWQGFPCQSFLGLPANLYACPYLLCILIYVIHLLLFSLFHLCPSLWHTVLPYRSVSLLMGLLGYLDCLFETRFHYLALLGLELAV